MKSLCHRILGIGGLAACLAFGGGVAQADIVTNQTGSVGNIPGPVVPDGGGFLWSYTTTISTSQQAGPNPPNEAFFTLYDFGPTIDPTPAFADPLLLAGWTLDIAFTHATTQPVADDPNLLNYRWILNDPGLLFPPGTTFNWALRSPFAGARLDFFDGSANTFPGGPPRTNSGLTFVPVPGPILAGGLPGLVLACGGFLAWMRRRPTTA